MVDVVVVKNSGQLRIFKMDVSQAKVRVLHVRMEIR